ncbi:MAG: class I adenylate-forming enzyme family protein [Saprospiraceae bacterium]
MMNICEQLFVSAEKWPEKIALIDESGQMTFQELADSVDKAASQLSGFGIKKGMGVGLAAKNSNAFVVMAYAIMKTGSVLMPVSSQMKAQEVEALFNEAKLHVLIDQQTGLSPIQTIAANMESNGTPFDIYWNESVSKEEIFAPHVPNAAFARFTSGTTGTSKGVVLSHESIAERTEAANKVLQLGPDDTVMWVLSMAYHFVVSITLYIRYGATVVVSDNFIADNILDLSNEHKATFFYGSPMHIRMLATDKSDRQLPNMKRVISTSTAISKPVCDAFFNRYALPVSQAYGIIEIGLPVINTEKQEEHPEAIGYALPDYEVEMLDENGKLLPPDTVGHLAMRGPGMLDAYLYPPRVREEILEDGWFLTGDLASKNKEGLIKVEGRKKSMINVSGNKVFPEEVEAIIEQFEGVQLARVSGFQHRFLGETVQAEIMMKEGFEQPDTEVLIDFCRNLLSTYKVPQKIVFVETLPMTDSGKLKRH